MSHVYYDPGQQRIQRVHALFNRIASRYDLLNDLQSFGLHRLWKRRLIKLAQVRPGDQALDVCCGTGDLTFGLARAGSAATGLDFNAAMLARAEGRRRHLPEPARDTVRFLEGDAQNLPFPEGTFDVIVVGYGLRNLASWQQGLAEMRRVARPSARLLVLDFGKPDNALWRALYFAYLRGFVPVLGKLFCGSWSAYSYILESLKHYPAQNGVAAEMRKLGLENVEVAKLLGGVMAINSGRMPALSR